MTVDEAIIDKLMSATALAAKVSGRIWMGYRPQSSTLPCIVVSRVDTTIFQGLTQRTGTERARFQIDVWSESQRNCREIADIVKTNLDGWTKASDPAISSCFLDNEIVGLEDTEEGDSEPLARIIQDIGVWYSAG